MTLLLDHPVLDPSQGLAFPMNVIALLPYMVQNYEDANELCIRSAENIARVSFPCGDFFRPPATISRYSIDNDLLCSIILGRFFMSLKS